MRETFLRSLRWILLLLAALTTRTFLDNIYLGMGVHQAFPWEILTLGSHIDKDYGPTSRHLPGVLLSISVGMCLFLLMFRYFTSSVFQLYGACYNQANHPIPHGFSQNGSVVSKLEIHHFVSMVLFIIPEFFFIYLGASSVRWIAATFLWLAFLPVVDILAFGLTGVILRLRAECRLWSHQRRIHREFDNRASREIQRIKLGTSKTDSTEDSEELNERRSLADYQVWIFTGFPPGVFMTFPPPPGFY